MATYNKFNGLPEYLMDMKLDLFGSPIGDSLKLGLSNSLPVATEVLWAQITEIGAGNGYAAGGTAVATVNGTRSGGTVTLDGTQVVFTASGGAIAQFRYIVLYDDTPTTPLDPNIAWWDYGSALDLNDGDSLTVKFNNASPGTIFTIA